MISKKQMQDSVNRVATLRYFPSDATVRATIGGMFCEICQTDEEAQRLADAMLSKFSDWPGPAALKEVHASLAASSRRTDARCPNCAPNGAVGWRELFIYVDRRTQREGSRVFPDGNSFEMDKRRELEEAVKRSENHDGYFAMARCSCPAGRRGAEYDAKDRHRYFDPSTIA